MMKAWSRLILFAASLAVVALLAFYLCQHILDRSAVGPVNYHYWIHSQLGLSDQQQRDLEPLEAKFAQHKDELSTSIREANRELAEALLADKSDSERVKSAVRKIHQLQGELQQTVLDHVFEMQSVLTPEQYDRLVHLTAHALRDAPEMR